MSGGTNPMPQYILKIPSPKPTSNIGFLSFFHQQMRYGFKNLKEFYFCKILHQSLSVVNESR